MLYSAYPAATYENMGTVILKHECRNISTAHYLTQYLYSKHYLIVFNQHHVHTCVGER